MAFVAVTVTPSFFRRLTRLPVSSAEVYEESESEAVACDCDFDCDRE